MRSFRSFAGGLGNNLFQFAYIYAQARKGIIPDVYLQDPAHFAGFEDEIRSLYGAGLEPVDMVSIHIRRGDYVNNPFYVNLCETDYYEHAMELFPGKKFLVFSDDRDFARTVFPDLEVYEGKDEVDDFNMMASCSAGNIIANSSFSWWCAFVNPSKTKKVVSPINWYSDGVDRTKCPEEWLRI